MKIKIINVIDKDFKNDKLKEIINKKLYKIKTFNGDKNGY